MPSRQLVSRHDKNARERKIRIYNVVWWCHSHQPFKTKRNMANIIIRPKDRNEWLRYREGGIGSSEVGTILGLNPFETPYQLWRRKKGIDAPKAETFLMKAGHYLEEAVSKFYADETGKDIIKSSAGDWLIVDKEKPFLRVSPDRTFWIPNQPRKKNNKGILECKTTQMDVSEDDVPTHWFAQLQYQLGVAGFGMGALAWLTQGRSFGYKELLFDEDFYAWEVEEVERFWLDYIQGDGVPDAICAQDVLLRSPRHVEGKTIEANDEILEACNQLCRLKDEEGKLSKQKKELEEEIKMYIGDAESLVTEDGKTLASWKAAKDGNKFNEKGFAAEHAELYAEYMQPVAGSRRFLVKAV